MDRIETVVAAVGLGLGGSSFGSLTVNGTLRMQQNSFDIEVSTEQGRP